MINNKILILPLSFCLFLSACSMLPYKENFSCEKGKDNGVCGSVTEVYDLSSDMDELRKQADRNYEAKHPEVKEDEKLKLEEEAKNNFKTLKLQEMVEAVEIRKIQNETPTIFRYYLSEEEAKNKANLALISTNDKENKAIRKSNQNLGNKSQAKNPHKSEKNKKPQLGAKNNSNHLHKGIKIYDLNQSDQNNTLVTQANQDSNLTKDGMGGNINNIDCSPSYDSKITQINDKVKVCVYHANIRAGASCKSKVLRIAKNGELLDALYEQGGWVKLKDGTYVHKSIVTQN